MDVDAGKPASPDLLVGSLCLDVDHHDKVTAAASRLDALGVGLRVAVDCFCCVINANRPLQQHFFCCENWRWEHWHGRRLRQIHQSVIHDVKAAQKHLKLKLCVHFCNFPYTHIVVSISMSTIGYLHIVQNSAASTLHLLELFEYMAQRQRDHPCINTIRLG